MRSVSLDAIIAVARLRGMAAPTMDIDAMLDALRGSGAKITTARRAVLEEFARTEGQHVSAEELTERVQARYPEVHLSTVYRTLEFLEREGLITRVHLKDGPAAYHFTANAHHHAVCDRCGPRDRAAGRLLPARDPQARGRLRLRGLAHPFDRHRHLLGLLRVVLSRRRGRRATSGVCPPRCDASEARMKMTPMRAHTTGVQPMAMRAPASCWSL